MTQVNLGTANEFIARHIGPRAADEQAMLNSLGFDSLEALSASVIPESIKGTSVLGMDDGLSEADALAMIKSIAGKNQLFKTYIGQGYYNCHTPSPILRNLLENPAQYTAYTPYQPEISRTSRSAAELPDPDQRPHRPANRQRLAARRSHRRCRSHDLLQTPEQKQGQPPVLRLDPQPPANPRRAAHPCRAAGHRRGGWR